MFERFLAVYPPVAGEPGGESRRPWPHGPVAGWDALMGAYAGRSFRDGLYRLHTEATGAALDRFLARAYSSRALRTYTFAFDWLGRQYVLDGTRAEDSEPLVGMFDTVEGADGVYAYPATFAAFHDVFLTEDEPDLLDADDFVAFAVANPGALPLRRDQVVGYRIPLILGGKHEVENMEVVDLEVELELTAQIGEQVCRPSPLAAGSPVEIDEHIALDSPHGRFLAEEVADLGIDPALPSPELQRALHAAIASWGDEARCEAEGSKWWAQLLGAGPSFSARSAEAALAWALLYLMAPEYGPRDDHQ